MLLETVAWPGSTGPMLSWLIAMSAFYFRVYNALPEWLKRRINPLEYSIRDFVREASRFRPSGTVLDSGAGESRFADLFADRFYLALDSCVGDANWDYSRVGIIADLHALPLSEASCDLVLNIQVLEHVKEPGLVLREIQRALKPGGRLYLTAPQGWHEHQQPEDYYRFTRYSLRLLFETAGFKSVSIEPMGGYFDYLGHRLTYVPKVLFSKLPTAVRVALMPLELAVLFAFCLVLPVMCHALDGLDRRKEFTLCYRCLAVK